MSHLSESYDDFRWGISDGKDAYFLIGNTLEVHYFIVVLVTLMLKREFTLNAS